MTELEKYLRLANAAFATARGRPTPVDVPEAARDREIEKLTAARALARALAA